MVESKMISGTLYVGLCGEIDEHTAPRVRAQLDEIFSATGIRKVVVELSKLKFMDSTGIGVMLGRYKLLKAKNIPIFIANPSKSIDKILKLSGIYSIMPKIEFGEN